MSRHAVFALFSLLALAAPLFSLFGKNRLADSQSPYLLQHADNPVDWYPWGDEAFAKAKKENKLVFLSIGYSTCHWCHVMNRESFSDEEIAQYLNANYVCIKIDREERPDIDSVYLRFVQNLRGSAGWPLNVFLTPDRKPFYGGTYFPPRDDPERGVGFLSMIREINETWQASPEAITERSDLIVASLRDTAIVEQADSASALSLDPLAACISAHYFRFDEQNKGFGAKEKFPSPTNLSMLLRAAATPSLHEEDRNLARRMALETLDTILLSGIRDHVGGGFHRYSVDPGWQLPHFEKMLYDQALIASALVDAWQLTGENRYQRAATETLDYLLRDMRHPDGGFYSAEDAESPNPKNPNTKREGAYYLWTTEELEILFPKESEREPLFEAFSIKKDGNAPEGDFPNDIFQGFNTLRLSADSRRESPYLVDSALETLRAARSTRERPHLDDKVITAWNGLAISALSRAGNAFQRPDYKEAATQAARFLLDKLYDSKSHTLSRLYRNGASSVDGFADDYAYLICGLLDLYEATADHQWIALARELQTTQDKRFLDAEDGGYFLFEANSEIAFGRSKLPSDSAIPAPTAISIENLVRLSQIFDDAQYLKIANASALNLNARLADSSASFPELRQALISVVKKPIQIVIAGDPDSPSVAAMRKVATRRLLPNRIILYADQAEGQAYLSRKLPFMESAQAYDNKATVFVCENFVCQMPSDDPARFAAQLDALR